MNNCSTSGNKPHTKLTLTGTDDDATAGLQAALDRAKDGPLWLRLEGIHHSTALEVFSDTTLELADGAELRFVPGYESYARGKVAVVAEDSDRAMIRAAGARNVAILGTGRIVCDGAGAYALGEDAGMGTRIPAPKRPRVLVMDGCRDVSITDITVLDSPMWTLHFVDCDGLQVSGVTVLNDLRMPNTDGIVIDGCRDVRVTGCEIRTADDGVVLKTSFRAPGGETGPCRNVEVRDCVIESRSCALKIGTESAAPFQDIAFTACRIERSNRALGIFSRDGGTIQGVRFADIVLDCIETPDGFWGSGEPVTITALDRRKDRPAGVVRDVVIRNISGSAPGAITLFAERSGLISDVHLSGISLEQRPGPLGTARAYDLRPTPADLEASPDAAGRKNAWRKGPDGRVIGLVDYPKGLPTIFACNVEGLSMEALDIIRPDPLPKGWALEPVTVI